MLLMSASKISWRSKQSLGTATCLHHSQVAISTLLWGYGAMISDGLTKLSKREERRDVNYPKQTLTSALRIQDSSGVSDKMNTFINYLYSMGFCFSSSLLVTVALYLLLIYHSLSHTFMCLLVPSEEEVLQKNAFHSPLEFDD